MDKKIDKSMLYDAVVCDGKDSVLEVSRIMRDTRARHLIVVDKKLKPLGIISPSDINNRIVAEEKIPNKVTASEIMTSPVETLDINSTYSHAAEVMALLEIFTIPVTENGELTGILDYSTVFRNACEVKNDKK